MRKHTPKCSSLFLLELIIAILFFSLASAVCIQLFAAAHVKSKETAALNMALSKAQTAAEGIRNSEDSADTLSLLFPDGQWIEAQLSLYYDADWNSCEKEKAFYSMVITLDIQGQTEQSEIQVSTLHTVKQTASPSANFTAADTLLYELTIKKHLAYTR